MTKSESRSAEGVMSGQGKRATRGGRGLRRLLSAGAVSLAAAASCSAPGKGALMLAISTDMQAPKDINVVSVFVAVDGVVKFDYLGRVLPNGTVALPSTLAIVQPDDPTSQVHIRVIAFKEQAARVLRDVLTTVPTERTALLRMPLDFLDDGSGLGTIPLQFVPEGVDDAPDGLTQFAPTTIGSSCDPMMLCPTGSAQCQTSINGVCGSAVVDSTGLPAYAAVDVYGDGGFEPSGALSSCFDVTSCFTGATPVGGLDMTSCSFTLPSGSTSPGGQDAGAVTMTMTPDGSATGTGVGVVDAGQHNAPGDAGGRCIPTTCMQLGYNCGQVGDGCGGILTCGTCVAPQYCGGGGLNLCGGNASVDAAPVAPSGDASETAQSAPVQLTGPSLNLALVTQSTGACISLNQCFVPVENDPTEGWTVTGSTVQLAAGICAKIQRGGVQLFMVEGTCPSIQLSDPVCEPVAPTGATSDGGAVLDASVTTTPDAGPSSCDGDYVVTCQPNAACGTNSGGAAALQVVGAQATVYVPTTSDDGDEQITQTTGTVNTSTCIATIVFEGSDGSCGRGGAATVNLAAGTTSGVPCSNDNGGTCTQGILSCTVSRGTLDAGPPVIDASSPPADATTVTPPQCPAGQTFCGNVCSDLTTDQTNCGQCGIVCAAGLACSNGTCVTFGSPEASVGLCTVDSDCAGSSSTPFCNTATGICQQCVVNTNCVGDMFCNSGFCVEEAPAEDAGTPVCGPGNCGGCCSNVTCEPGQANSFCGVAGNPCVDCTAMGGTCSAGACILPGDIDADAIVDATAASCGASGPCTGATPICNIETAACVQCLSSSDCPASAPACSATNACVQCVSNSNCTDAAANICNTSTNTCMGG